MRTFPTILSLVFLGACGFGDDGKLQSIDATTIDAGVDAPEVDAMPMAQTFEARPSQAIPDNNPAGTSIPFNVSNVTFTTGVDVQVDVSHTFRGDIRIELLRGTSVLKVLKAEDGLDSADNIQATYPVSTTELGTPLNAIYSVRFIDTDAGVTGTVNLVRLTFKVN